MTRTSKARQPMAPVDDATAAARAQGGGSGVDSLLWKCPICLETLARPVLTTCCGQSFCQACLDAALRLVDACPMCREPLLSGRHAMTRNRALEELLARMQPAVAADGEPSAHEVLISIRDLASDRVGDPVAEVATDPHCSSRSVRRCVDDSVAKAKACVSWRRGTALASVRAQQWRHWCRIHWSTLQCVFYVWLFAALVFFLRVQEEDFAEHDPHR